MILAVDGGNSKTDVALLDEDGTVLGHARGPQSSPHHLGLEASVDVVARLAVQAGLHGRRARVARVMLAGVDFPEEERELHGALAARGWADAVLVGNDTFAVLRAGTERGWGVAVTCGAGINCVGVGPDGDTVRFPALGVITGDWGGGYDVGLAAISAAARSEDRRGPLTALEQLVPAHFGLATPLELAYAIHTGRVPQRRAVELAPIVFASAADDPVADEIVVRLADEIVALVRAALTRLALDGDPVDVVLGGGLMRGADERLLGRIRGGLAGVGADVMLQHSTVAPIVGAALLALDDVGAERSAHERARSELAAAFERVEEVV
jgi:N-acetylglucosamine kinase-like BadF-type ATPase